MDITRRKPASAAARQAFDLGSDLTWSRVALKPQRSQNGVLLPCSVQHRLWIQPSRHYR